MVFGGEPCCWWVEHKSVIFAIFVKTPLPFGRGEKLGFATPTLEHPRVFFSEAELPLRVSVLCAGRQGFADLFLPSFPGFWDYGGVPDWVASAYVPKFESPPAH